MNLKFTEEQLMDFHRPRMRALIEAGADVVVIDHHQADAELPYPEGRACAEVLRAMGVPHCR